VTLPGFELVLLRGTDGAADYLKDVGGSAVVAVVQSNGDAYDRFGAEFARGLRGHRCHQTPVGQAPRTDHDRLESPGKAQLARMASARLPCLKTTGSPVPRSVATMAVG